MSDPNTNPGGPNPGAPNPGGPNPNPGSKNIVWIIIAVVVVVGVIWYAMSGGSNDVTPVDDGAPVIEMDDATTDPAADPGAVPDATTETPAIDAPVNDEAAPADDAGTID